MKRSGITIVVVLVLVTGCIQQEEEIEYSDFNEDLACIFPLGAPEDAVITSQEEYEKLLEYTSESPDCRDFVLPFIDFSEYTLLGKHAYGVGCSTTFVRHVYKDTENKKIIYSIVVVEEGNCEMIGMSMNWIKIPKIPPGYTVVFEVCKKQAEIFPLMLFQWWSQAY